MIYLEPEQSKLGIKIYQFDKHINAKGILQVAFRYDNNELQIKENGLQIQYETILVQEFRGNHYHYPDYAAEEFFLINGNAVLIVCDLNSEIFEIYKLKKNVSYYVPAFIAHKVINIGNFYGSNDVTELLISKHYNYSKQNLQIAFEVYHKELESAILALATTHENEKL